MNILEKDHGVHDEILHLNPNFIQDACKLKMTVEVDEKLALEFRKQLPRVAGRLAVLFPTLAIHRCCDGMSFLETLFSLENHAGSGAGDGGASADVAHVLEHVMVDIVSSLSGVRKCSGITCGHRDPENLFDIFVECRSAALADFAARIAFLIVSELPEPGARYGLYVRSLWISRLIAGKEMKTVTLPAIAGEVTWDHAEISESLDFLGELGFLTRKQFAMNYSGTGCFEVIAA